MDKEQLIDDLNRVADDINSEMYETALDDLTDIISEVELMQEPSNDRTALLKEANRLLAEIVEDGILGQKWTKRIDDFLSRADQS